MIPFVDFKPMEYELKDGLVKSFNRVLNSSNYILGDENIKFENIFSSFLGVKYTVGCSNGLDAIMISLKALGVKEGDEVIVPSNTYIATALAVTYVGATPVFVEPNIYTYNIDCSLIESQITKKTKAIIPVHLYGQACDMNKILEIAKKYNLYVVEDCAQSHNATYKNRLIGTFGNLSAFSFYPGKNIGALGDAGAIVGNDKDLIDKCRAIANYGSDYKYHHIYKGFNCRLDELQAAFLQVKIQFIDKMTKDRRRIARKYLEGIVNDKLVVPFNDEVKNITNLSFDEFINNHVFHVFAIRSEYRDSLEKYLSDNGVCTNKHYPIPIHLQKCDSDLGFKEGDYKIAEEISRTELSLPLYYGMKDEDVDRVIDLINYFDK